MSYIRGFTERGIALDPETREYFLERDNEEGARFLRQHFEEVSAGRFRPRSSGPVAKVVSFSRSAFSGRGVAREVFLRRKLSCFGDGASVAPCPALERTEAGAFCRECECGRWQLANLEGRVTSKLAFEYLECPLKRPGFSNEAVA